MRLVTCSNSIVSYKQKQKLSSPKSYSKCFIGFEYFFLIWNPHYVNIINIIKSSLIFRELIFNPEPKPMLVYT